ncbi:hypothetical protein ACFWZ3_00945 [Frateuria sp. GZRR35]|uniref:hypothetical protein n=1 Tax=unclassified Frateuria TaxID=2648894 RepID=UPI003EDBCD12
MPAFPTTGRRALRRGRTSIPGQVYLLTTTTCRRQPRFAETEPARTACRVIAAQPT